MYVKTTPATLAAAGTTLPFTGLSLMTLFYVSLALVVIGAMLRLAIARLKTKT